MLLVEPVVISEHSFGIRAELKRLRKEYCTYNITNKARQMSAGLYIFVEKLSTLCYNKRNNKDLDGEYGF